MHTMMRRFNLSSREWSYRKALLFFVGLGSLAVSVFGLVQQALTEPKLQVGETLAPRYAYLVDCGGTYVKVDTNQYQIASHGRIWDGPSTSSIRPDHVERFDGCLFNNAENDAKRGLLYAVVQKHAFYSPQGDNEFWVAALRLSDFALVSKAGPFELFPWLLLDPDTDSLLVWSVDIIERYGIPVLKKLETRRNPSDNLISDRASFMSDEQILDEDRILDRRGNLKRRVDPQTLLTPAIKATFRQQLALGMGAEQHFAAVHAGSRGERALFLVNPDTRQRPAERSGLLVYDLGGEQTMPPITAPYRAYPTTVHLADNGSLVVIEEYEWRPSEEADQQLGTTSSGYDRFKTGTIAVYDASDGRFLQTIALEPPPGFLARVIGFSPEGTLMLYGSRTHIYVVDLRGHGEPQALPTIEGFFPNQQFPPLAVFFADR